MIDLLSQLALGFVICLSGALIPGPLLVFIVTHTLRTGERSAGFFAGLGHCFVEVFIVFAILLGLSAFFESAIFQLTVRVVGEFALFVFGVLNLLELRKGKLDLKDNSNRVEHSSFVGGVIFTVFNATIPLWWGTVGLTMLNNALRNTTMLGVALWVLGHWLADLGWFGFAGYSIFKGKNYIGKRTHRHLIMICGIILIVLGTIFMCSLFIQ